MEVRLLDSHFNEAAAAGVHSLLELLAPGIMTINLANAFSLLFQQTENTYNSNFHMTGRVINHFILGLYKLFGSEPQYTYFLKTITVSPLHRTTTLMTYVSGTYT